jgi:hypothetical protein
VPLLACAVSDACCSKHWLVLRRVAAHRSLLVESKADVAARNRCLSPPPSHYLSLTICLAVGWAKLLLKSPSNTIMPTLLHTCAASARRVVLVESKAAKPTLLCTCAASAHLNDAPAYVTASHESRVTSPLSQQGENVTCDSPLHLV